MLERIYFRLLLKYFFIFKELIVFLGLSKLSRLFFMVKINLVFKILIDLISVIVIFIKK